MENILLDQVLKQVQEKEISIEKARELICVLFNVSNSFDEEMKVEDCGYYCSDECDCIGEYCGYGK
jgi:hypothetical protein